MSVALAALCGSLREGSFNRKLLAIAVEVLKSAGAEVDVIDLKKLTLPIFDQDTEGSPTAAVVELRERLGRAEGVLFCSPEYNFSVPGGLKNAIDWGSRPVPGKPAFRNKVAAIMGVSGGPSGTIRMQAHLRLSLTGVGMLVVPAAVSISHGQLAFDEHGGLKDERVRSQVTLLAQQLVKVTQHNPLLAAS